MSCHRAGRLEVSDEVITWVCLGAGVLLGGRVTKKLAIIDSIEHSGSGVELRTLNYENLGSNPGCGVKTLGKFFHSTLLQFTQLNK